MNNTGFKPLIFLIIIVSYFATGINTLNAQDLNKIEITSIEQFQTVAPGESLPINIKLINMGGSGRVDVRLKYNILDTQNNILSEESETVAVETTANFIKQVKIPPDLKPGRYFLLADLQYPDQKFPAISKIPFQVEYKFLGFFKNQLIVLGLAILSGIILIFLTNYFVNKPRKIILSQFNYNKIPSKLRPYYELISDIILTMRLNLGLKAIKIANKISGLKVSESGKVLKISKEPAEIITLLTVAYEKELNFQGLNVSQKAIEERIKKSPSLETKIEYQKTANLVDNVAKFFIKK